MRGLEIVGQVDFEGHAWTAELAKFKLDKTDLRGALIRRADGGYVARIDGGSLDLEPILFGTGKEPREAEASSESAAPYVVIDAIFDSVRTGTESRVGPTEVQARSAAAISIFLCSMPNCRTTSIFAQVIRLKGPGMHCACEAMMRVKRWSLLDGVTNSKAERWWLKANAKSLQSLTGLFKLEGYKISNAPALARLLQVASLTGIFDALKRGLDFVSFDGKYAYRDAILQIEDRAHMALLSESTPGGALDLKMTKSTSRGPLFRHIRSTECWDRFRYSDRY